MRKVPEVRNVEGRPHVARKRLHHDQEDPQIEPYGPWDQFTHDSA